MLVWIDLETTGLDPKRHALLEVAVVVTDDDLSEQGHFSSLIIDTDPRFFVQQDRPNDSRLHAIYPGHFKNGLVDALRAEFNPAMWDDDKLAAFETHSVCNVQYAILRFLNGLGAYENMPMKDRPPLCGSTVSFDRGFLEENMPKVLDVLHYRNVDVSTIRELAHRWWPSLPDPEKKGAHRALDDIRESINLLRYYREKEFICGA